MLSSAIADIHKAYCAARDSLQELQPILPSDVLVALGTLNYYIERIENFKQMPYCQPEPVKSGYATVSTSI